MYVPEGEKTIRHAYKSKYNLTRENQVILLMISDGEKWHYLTVRSLSTLFKGITSKHKGDSYCLNCFHSCKTKEALENHMKVCEDKDYCYIEIPEKGASIKYHPGVKSMRVPYALFADIESLPKKVDTCTNGPDKSSTTQLNKHEMCGYSLVMHCSFNEKNNVIDYYRGKDCLKKFLPRQAKSIVDFEIKEKIKLTQEEQYKHDSRKCCFCVKNYFLKILKIIILK